jgi:hypothetical protein
MERKVIILLVIVGVLTISITCGVWYFYGEEIELQPQIKPLENCNVLYDNGGPVNIVFLADGETAKKYADYLLSVYPFSRNKEAFNFYYILSDVVEKECKTYKGIALLCYSKNLVREASACPSDYIVVLKEMPSSIRSSAFMNVMSLNTAHSLSVFAHEFGHAFANFAEEYATNAKVPKGSLNCQEKCEGFGGIEDGCYPECTDSSHVRSIYDGVMRTLSSDRYGTFNEYLLKERISQEEGLSGESSITGNAVGGVDLSCAEQQYRLLVLKYNDYGDKDAVKVLSDSADIGCAGSPGFGSVDLEYIQGEMVLKSKTNPVYIYTTDADSEILTAETYDNTRESDGVPVIIKIPLNREEESKVLTLTRVVTEEPEKLTPSTEEVKTPEEVVQPSDEETIQQNGEVVQGTEIRRVEVPLSNSIEPAIKTYTKGGRLLLYTQEAASDAFSLAKEDKSKLQGDTSAAGSGNGGTTVIPNETNGTQSEQYYPAEDETYYSVDESYSTGDSSGAEQEQYSTGDGSLDSTTAGGTSSLFSPYAIFDGERNYCIGNIICPMIIGVLIGLILIFTIFKGKFFRKKSKSRNRR